MVLIPRSMTPIRNGQWYMVSEAALQRAAGERELDVREPLLVSPSSHPLYEVNIPEDIARQGPIFWSGHRKRVWPCEDTAPHFAPSTLPAFAVLATIVG